jgi:hypothetical protein
VAYAAAAAWIAIAETRVISVAIAAHAAAPALRLKKIKYLQRIIKKMSAVMQL